MVMDREWMYETFVEGRLNNVFQEKLQEFLDYAVSHPECMDLNKIRCPCSKQKCKNLFFQSVDEVHFNVIKFGFMNNYYQWIALREQWVGDTSRAFSDNETGSVNEMHIEVGGQYREMVLQGLGVASHSEYMEEEPNEESKKLFQMIKVANEKLWLGCQKHTKLSAMARMFNMKAEHHFSERCFDQIAEFIKEVLPEDNVFPKNFYRTKRLIEGLGLPVQKIDCCRNNCMIYWGGDVDLLVCKFCQQSRYKRAGNVKKAYKVMHYFPLIPRLQRLYASNATANDMRWHAEHKSEEGVMRHPSESPAWKHFHTLYPSFASETQNVMLGLSSDGFQPFGHYNKPYLSWPIIITPYNLPPWMCGKSEYMFLTVLVPGPNNPKMKIDVYLQPLIVELKQLWDLRVMTYNVSSKQNFVMHAALLWTISNFPALSMLFGWSTGGRLSCPHCMEDTDAFTLPNRSKQTWFDNHRKFLPADHPW